MKKIFWPKRAQAKTSPSQNLPQVQPAKIIFYFFLRVSGNHVAQLNIADRGSSHVINNKNFELLGIFESWVRRGAAEVPGQNEILTFIFFISTLPNITQPRVIWGNDRPCPDIMVPIISWVRRVKKKKYLKNKYFWKLEGKIWSLSVSQKFGFGAPIFFFTFDLSPCYL
jgi:hypothetical protein